MNIKKNSYGCVYKFTCKETNKSYVGKTIQLVDQRLQKHISNVACGSETKFHRAIRKYGIGSFELTILEWADTKEKLNEAENYWIDKLDTIKSGYNITKGGNGGSKPSPVSVYTEDGELLGRFNAMSEASIKYGVTSNRICACFTGRQKTAGTYEGKRLVWTQGNDTFPNIDFSKVRTPQKIPVVAYGEGFEIEFNGVREAQRFFGIASPTMISDCIYGRRNRKTAGKYNGRPIHWKLVR